LLAELKRGPQFCPGCYCFDDGYLAGRMLAVVRLSYIDIELNPHADRQADLLMADGVLSQGRKDRYPTRFPGIWARLLKTDAALHRFCRSARCDVAAKHARP